jgi:adenylosuccinate synthase
MLTQDFGPASELAQAQPQYETFEGWDEQLSDTHEFGELPVEARRYVNAMEAYVGRYVRYVSVGPGA